MVATLSQRHKEVKNELIKLIQKDHQELIESQDILKIQSRKRNLKFIVELTKFGLWDTEIVLSRFKEWLEDLKGQNPEILFGLIESCGRFLMKKEKMDGYTKLSFGNMLDKLWDTKIHSVLSDKAVQYIENAYFYCRPSESASMNKQSKMTEEESKIYNLLFDKLNNRTAEIVAKQMKETDYKNNAKFWLESIINYARMGTFSDLDTISYVVQILIHSPMDHLMIRMCDKLETNILSNIDNVNISGYQARIQEVNFFSTLYFYQIVNTQSLFNILYNLIPVDHQNKAKSDVNFRIRMACTLLQNLSFIGLNENNKSRQKRAKANLKTFMNHLYIYTFVGKWISLDLEYYVLDTFEAFKHNRNSKNMKKQMMTSKDKKGLRGPVMIVDDPDDDNDENEEEKEGISSEEAQRLVEEERKAEFQAAEDEFEKELKQMVSKSFTKGKQKRPLVKFDQSQMLNVLTVFKNSKELKQE